MTADDIFDTTLTLMFASADEKTDYQTAFLSALNLTLAETFNVNNSIRVSKDLAELTAIPTIAATTETMTYDDVVCRRILPYGIAGMIMAEDDKSQAIQYKNKYEYEIANSYNAAYVEIADYYSEEE